MNEPHVQKPISVVWSVDGADIDPRVLNFEEESADAGRRTGTSGTHGDPKGKDRC